MDVNAFAARLAAFGCVAVFFGVGCVRTTQSQQEQQGIPGPPDADRGEGSADATELDAPGVAADGGGASPGAGDASTADAWPDATTGGNPFAGEAGAIATAYEPLAVAASGSYVFWTDDVCGGDGCEGTVSGFGPKGAVSAYNPYPTTFAGALAVDSANAYWTSSTEIWATRIDGTGNLVFCAADPNLSPFAIAVTPTDVYWMSEQRAAPAHDVLFRSPLSGCGDAGAATMATLPTTVGSDTCGRGTPNLCPFAVAADATDVYFTDRVGGTVAKCAAAGCNGQPTVLASGQAVPYGIAVAGGNVFWVNQGLGKGAGSVAKCSVNGCALPTVLASGLNAPFAIVVDATNVYWTNVGDGTVMKCGVNGCAQPTVVSTGGVPLGIAVDDVNVYWANVRIPGYAGMTAAILTDPK
jgi:hypothetical protein